MTPQRSIQPYEDCVCSALMHAACTPERYDPVTELPIVAISNVFQAVTEATGGAGRSLFTTPEAGALFDFFQGIITSDHDDAMQRINQAITGAASHDGYNIGRYGQKLLDGGIIPPLFTVKAAATTIKSFACMRDFNRELQALSNYATTIPFTGETPINVAARMDLLATDLRTANISSAVTQQEHRPFSECLKGMVEEYTNRLDAAENGVSDVTQTGLDALDELTGGVYPGDLVVIAGRPSMGKSALIQNITINQYFPGYRLIAEHIKANETSLPVIASYSLEMTETQWTARLTSAACAIEADRIKKQELDRDDFARMGIFLSLASQIPLRVLTPPDLTITGLYQSLRKIKAELGRVDIIIIDYLTLMTPEGATGNSNTDFGNISKRLKSIAKEFNAKLFLLSQLNRDCEKRSDKRPCFRICAIPAHSSKTPIRSGSSIATSITIQTRSTKVLLKSLSGNTEVVKLARPESELNSTTIVSITLSPEHKTWKNLKNS